MLLFVHSFHCYHINVFTYNFTMNANNTIPSFAAISNRGQRKLKTYSKSQPVLKALTCSCYLRGTMEPSSINQTFSVRLLKVNIGQHKKHTTLTRLACDD